MLKQRCTLKKRVYVNRICGLPMSISTTRQQINPWWVYNCPYLANPLLFCKGQLKPGRLCIYRILWYHMVSYILLYLIHLILIFFVSFLYCNLILSLFIDSNLVYLCLSSLIYQEMYSCIDLSIYKPIHLPTYTSTPRRITMSPLKAMMPGAVAVRLQGCTHELDMSSILILGWLLLGSIWVFHGIVSFLGDGPFSLGFLG